MDTNSSTTSSDTAEKTSTLALLAILEHAADHGLQVTGLDAVDRFVHHLPRVRVAPEHIDSWVATLNDVSAPRIRAFTKGPWQTVIYTGRIATAIGDLQLEVSTTRRTVMHLIGGRAS